MNFGYHTQACECFSNKSLILPQKEAGTLFCLLTIEESMRACVRVQLRRTCVLQVCRIKYLKPQMYSKSCLEKGKGGTFPLKPFEILPSKSFEGLWAVKLAK